MKRFFLTVLIALSVSVLTANAQSGGLFGKGEDPFEDNMMDMPLVPGHDLEGNQSTNGTPLGEGLILLIGLGMIYCEKSKYKNRKL